MRIPYSWLTDYLRSEIVPEELAEVLTMGGLEVEEIRDWTSEDGKATDKVLVTKITANRGDLLSMIGVARQAAALLGCEWALPDLGRPEITAPLAGAPLVEAGDVKIEVQDLKGCPRYSALAIRDLKTGPSPDWLRYRLEAAGIRSVSNIVDVTNYVCWELGQPMHAFDLRLVARNHIIVRRAHEGEALKLIDGSTANLVDQDLMICDEMGPVGIAGVMGGSETEVNERTKMVLLESAHFDPTSLRRSAQRYGLSTEASYRFERFVDPNMTLPALARATTLMLQLAGGTPDATAIDVRDGDFTASTVQLRPQRCNQILGTELTAEKMSDYLERLGMSVDGPGDDGRLSVRVPTFRWDVEREIDLIEEVAIVHGYNNIPMTVPGNLLESGVLTARQKAERRLRDLMRQCGLNETISFSFMGMADLDRCGFAEDAPERTALKLLMPVASDMSHLRTSLIPGLLNACSVNVRQRVLDVALYDLDRVFIPQGERELPQERVRVAGLVTGVPFTSDWNLSGAEVDFYWLKGIVEQVCDAMNVSGVEYVRDAHPAFHPGRCAQVTVEGKPAGVLGEVVRQVQEAYDLPANTYLFELDLDTLLEGAAAFRVYDPLPRFPAALRDIALVVTDDEAHTAAALEAAVRKAAGEYLWKVVAFDLYTDAERLGAGRKSVAFRLTFRAADRTLTDEELDGAMNCVAQHLAETLGAEVRTA
ncbi:MAG: phenylalanine--tRNA ligase subunit beta [Armatimonadia bacterium]